MTVGEMSEEELEKFATDLSNDFCNKIFGEEYTFTREELTNLAYNAMCELLDKKSLDDEQITRALSFKAMQIAHKFIKAKKEAEGKE